MKKRKFQKGAVSIFLVIVLVPCMVISSMFVDMSRVVLAKGYTTSAADLALNSLMANYDPDLSEYYGMVASCQDINEFYEESAYMFLEALYSQGIEADDADSLLGYINAMALGTDVHDLYKLDVQTETEKIVTPVKNASLGESAVIIKDSVVEFMKYRGPIEITSKVIDRLKKTNAASVLTNSSADDALVEEKKDYAEKEEDFMDAAYKTYKKVVEYNNLKDTYKLNAKTMQTMLDDLSNARETYREVVQIMVSNLNGNSKTLSEFKRPVRELNAFTYEAKDVSSREKDGTYYIDGDDIEDLLEDLSKKIKKFKEARDAVSDKVVEVDKKLITGTVSETGDNNYHPIQWWKKIHGLVNSGSNSLISKVGPAADNMLKAYAKVLAMDGCTPGKDLPSGWSKTRSELMQSVEDLQARYLTADTFIDKDNLYLKLVNKLEDVSTKYKGKITVAGAKLKNGETTTQALERVQKQLSGHVDKLDECIKLLNTIINGGAWSNPYSLNKLGDKAKAYGEAFEDWSDTADVTDTELGKNDRAEIEKKRNSKDEDDTAPGITKDDVSDFKTRASNIKSKLESVKKAITDMKLNGKKITDIKNYTTAYNQIEGDIGENLTNKKVKDKAATIFKNKFSPYSEKKAAVKSIDFSDKNYSPDFNENKPKFYDWMVKQFGDITDGAVKKAKNKKDEKKTEAENAETAAKDADRSGNASEIDLYGNEDYVGADFPSGLDGNLKFSLAKGFLSSLGNTVTSLTSGSFDSIRDSLYSTEYVMDMFSYATYVNEGKYRLGIDNGTYKSAAEAEKAFKDNGYKAVTGAKDKPGTWLSEDTIDRYNKTLTNKMINSTNNILHGAEVEYILYGNTNEKNIKSAYTDIYLLRLPLNTVSAFQNFWSASDPNNKTARAINSAAVALSSATGGVVPVAAIKVVALTLLAVTETAKDLDRLQKGFQVELYKDKWQKWACSIDGTGEGADSDFSAKGGSDKVCENGLFYSDYLYLFTLLGFQSDSASEMYRRTADLIQVNMRKYTGDSGYKMKNAKSYFQIDATIRVDPLMLALPISQTVSNNPADRTDWCTFKINTMRGYS